MKTTLVFKASGDGTTVEISVDVWPKFIRRGDCFDVSAIGILTGGIATVGSITWGCDVSTTCRVDCRVGPDTMYNLATQPGLKKILSDGSVLRMSVVGWKGNELD